jgi:hypothetical protein
MAVLFKIAHLATSEADVPHAAARQHFDSVPLIVDFGLGFIHRAHGTGTENIMNYERTEHQALAFAIEQAVSLEPG